MTPVLEVEGLRTHFFTKQGVVKAVDDVSFTVGRGEVVGLVGESGSGKSMTGYSIMGLIDPPGRIVEGRIRLNGVDLRALPEEGIRRIRGNRVAMIFQDPMMTLNPVLRIDAQMIEAILAHEKTSVAAARARARDALARVGIPSPDARLAAYPHQFSGGMRQRVAIAIALEATLSFLGLGLPITEPSLGLLIANGYQYLLSGKYWISFFPGIALLCTIVSINLVADQLRDVLNPRLQK